MRTWHKEAIVVAAILTTVVIATGGRFVEWVGALAVFVTFLHCQVCNRLEEAADLVPDFSYRVNCYKWQTRYLLGKEALWLVYFVVLGAWSALVGVGIFLIYPIWRKYRGI